MNTTLDEKTRLMLIEWLKLHRGSIETLARWMRDTLRIRPIGSCRAMIHEALSTEPHCECCASPEWDCHCLGQPEASR